MTEGGEGSDRPVPQANRHGGTAVITDARMSTSAEMSKRIRRYTITMAFRTACFVSMIFVSGPARWVLLAAAIVLPYIAVLFANQANQRTPNRSVTQGVPSDLPQLTVGNDVVSGYVVDDSADDNRADDNRTDDRRADDPRADNPRNDSSGPRGPFWERADKRVA